MKELTDLEICQKIAEIENYRGWEKMSTRGVAGVFNPLTDDGLGWRLEEKYNELFSIECYTEDNQKLFYTWVENKDGRAIPIGDYLERKRVLCLAIIEAHS